jgi:6-phosphogluconolactonase
MTREIEAFPDDAALAAAAADATVRALTAALVARGQASFIGTGGRSPGRAYDHLARARLDWGRVTVSLSDDRFVAAEAPESNERLLRERLLVDAAAAAAFQPLHFPVASPELSAEAAEPHVRALAPFDMLWLGMGEDGHMASLIPGSPVLAAGMDLQGERFVIGVPAGVGAPPVARISLTLPALLQARTTLILISGALKRQIVETGDGLPVHSLLKQAKAPVRVLWTP